MNLGLTGDIGSGKSTVLGVFASCGWNTFSADEAVHRLLASDPDTLEAVSARFGTGVLKEEGGVDRKALGSIVFADPDAREDLESILHPRVRIAWKHFVQVHEGALNVVEIPLLFEKRLENDFRFCVTVWAHSDVKVRRLEQRGMDLTSIKRRMDAQLPQNTKATLSHFVISNNGSIAFLEDQVRLLTEMLRSEGCS